MKDLLEKYKTLFIVATALFLILVVVRSERPGAHDIQDSNPLRQANYAALSSFQNHNDFLVGNIASFWNDYVNLIHTENDNKLLRAENARLREENSGLQGILQQNARLQKMVGFKQSHPVLNLIPARVVASDISPFFRILKIRLKLDENVVIKPGMPVVSEDGVVGRIESVFGQFADVMLSIDIRSHIDVISQINRSRGMVSGTGNPNSYAAKLSYLLRRDEVEDGELLVTSGKGNVFPKELIVGRIKKINDKNYGLFQNAEVEPVVDFSRLEEVYVITNNPDKP